MSLLYLVCFTSITYSYITVYLRLSPVWSYSSNLQVSYISYL